MNARPRWLSCLHLPARKQCGRPPLCRPAQPKQRPSHRQGPPLRRAGGPSLFPAARGRARFPRTAAGAPVPYISPPAPPPPRGPQRIPTCLGCPASAAPLGHTQRAAALSARPPVPHAPSSLAPIGPARSLSPLRLPRRQCNAAPRAPSVWPTGPVRQHCVLTAGGFTRGPPRARGRQWWPGQRRRRWAIPAPGGAAGARLGWGLGGIQGPARGAKGPRAPGCKPEPRRRAAAKGAGGGMVGRRGKAGKGSQ
jgi:hypothetical protein